MKNDFNTAGRAVYLPAVNSTFARTAVIADITDRPFPAGLTVDDLVYWNDNKLFNYPYLLHSIGLYKVGAVDDTAVSRIERGGAVVLGAGQRKQYDSVSLMMLVNHDIWVTLKAIEMANDTAFAANSRDATPSTLVDCIGYIEEVFDIAYSKGDWRKYLSEHKALFDAHSQSIYS